ncbi:3197_t:CDS:2 [Funneliformis geosporum]|uniref:15564_t:CDS:1 n=1 Tax=Funneliformis geosporum TaxID=1117311 RepID=A0A9W4WT20_9GLOM|nr:15564_t:CDS:2 [Funneliformis geosporum]CAI2185514.1 3197_t:CDS:2 [Funneliformis geosporum]
MSCGSSGVTSLGGIAILVSAMIGPGLVTIPILFETAGWITPMVMFGLAILLASCSSLLLIEALSSIPGNERFQKKIEFISLFNILIDNRMIRLTIGLILLISIESMIIATIALTSQSFDAMLIRFTGQTCGIGIYPDGGWICIQNLGDYSSPFGNRLMAFTGGLLITFIIVTPMAFCNLGENVKVQIISFVTLIFVVVTWSIACIASGLKPDRIPLIGTDQSLLVGTVLFNYAFITNVPSIVNDMNRDVSIRKVIWLSVGITTLTYISMGVLGAMAFHLDLSSNIISEIRHSKIHNIFTEIATFLFPFGGLLASIPVDTIVVRYNLVRSGICDYPMAAFISLIVPWCLVIPFQTGYCHRKARVLQTLELAREASANGKHHHHDKNNDKHDQSALSQNYTRESITLPPHSSSSNKEEKELSSYQTHLEKHLQNPQFDKLKRPKMYRHMSADAMAIDDLSDILNDKLSNKVTPTELYDNEKSIIPSHTSTPRSASTDDDEFYHLFNYSGGKPFRAFPGTTKSFGLIVSYLSIIVSFMLIGGVIVYDFIGLVNGRNYFDLDSNT